MNKGQLIENISNDAGISKAEATKALESFLESTTKALKQGETVALTGFGSFTPKQKAAGTARNPKTGETVQVAAKTVVKFKAGKGLKDSVN